MNAASTRQGNREHETPGPIDPASSMRRAESILILTLWMGIAAALRPAMEYLEEMGGTLPLVASALELSLRAALAS